MTMKPVTVLGETLQPREKKNKVLGMYVHLSARDRSLENTDSCHYWVEVP